MKYADNSFVSEKGSPIHDIYSPVVEKDGTISLIKSGEENTDDIIQSYLESTDISIIMENVKNGDLSGLNVARGMYGDFTNMPKTYAELLQLQIDAKNTFDKLPNDVRMKFDNDVNVFLASAGDKEWFEKLGAIEKEEIKEEREVKEE